MSLYKTYRARKLPGFFACHWQYDQDWVQRREQLVGRRIDARLLKWMEDYNRGLGCKPAAMANLELLKGGALVVVTGQQAGLLTGPLYTVYKALTAINEAGRLARLLDSPVVPVFWLASEDHDFAEVRSAAFPAPDGPKNLSFPGEYLLTPAARIRLTPEDVNFVLAGLKAVLPTTDFSPEVLELISDAGQQAVSYADWCAGTLSRLFSGRGLVLLDSTAPPLRWLAQDVFRLAATQGEEIHQLLGAEANRLRQAGFTPGLDVPPDHSHLFWLEGNSRVALLREGDRISGRRGEISFSQAELLGAIGDSPENFSPNVVLRPLVQELAMPVLGMVVGPGETGYMAQLPGVFALLGLTPPILIPRMGGIILEPPLERLLNRYQLTPAQLPQLADWLQQQLDEGEGGRTRAEFSRLRGALSQAWDQLAPLLKDLDSQLPELAEKNLVKVLDQVDWLEKKAIAAVMKNNDQLLRHVQRLNNELAPPEGQERLYNIFWYLNKYGLELLNTLASISPEGDQVIRPGRND